MLLGAKLRYFRAEQIFWIIFARFTQQAQFVNYSRSRSIRSKAKVLQTFFITPHVYCRVDYRSKRKKLTIVWFSRVKKFKNILDFKIKQIVFSKWKFFSRHTINRQALTSHLKSKQHKQRVKKLKMAPYSHKGLALT